MELNFSDILNNAHFRNEYWVLIIPSILMAFDILTGVIGAWKTGHLKSYKMREGLSHKAGELCILLIGELFSYGLQLSQIFMVGISFYVILMELISIAENIDKIGIWLPKFVKNAFRNAKEKLENDDNPLKPNDISGKEDATDESDDGGNSSG